jgi:hypothetical protein
LSSGRQNLQNSIAIMPQQERYLQCVPYGEIKEQE